MTVANTGQRIQRVQLAKNLPVGGAVLVVLWQAVGPGVAPGHVEERHKGRVEGREVVRRHIPEEGGAHDGRCAAQRRLQGGLIAYAMMRAW